MSSKKEFWDKHAKVYDLFIAKDKKAYEKIYSQIRNKLNDDMNVLEVCTGTGIVSRNVCDKVKCITAIDYSSKMIEIAKKKSCGKDIKYMVNDAYNLDFEDDSFDAVIIMNSLHILENPYLVLSEIKRVLKNKGILIAPNFTHKKSPNKLFLLSKLAGFNATYAWDSKDYAKFLEVNGFKVVKTNLFKSSYPITYVEANKYI